MSISGSGKRYRSRGDECPSQGTKRGTGGGRGGGGRGRDLKRY